VRFIYKLWHPKHIPVIGNGNPGHPVLLGFFYHLTDARGTIQHTKLRVIMEM
jgi:hypothetical protein